ncbi:RAI1 like PD-XK nuclease-domain-containing protein [Hyaloraphidium curvatum]|nr:RAI1 like PD-XK nuclease-domain-containing protein [Hyaloraphidium curvatum]
MARPKTAGAFEIPPADRLDREGVPFQRPLQVACFSWDANRRLALDDRGLRFYAPPNIAVPLSAGFESYVTRALAVPEHLDALLAALLAGSLVTPHPPATPEARRHLPAFVTWRGILTKLFSAAHDRREPFELRATRFNGTIYLVENELPEKAERERNMSAREALFAYGGYKFEALCTLPVPFPKATEQMLQARDTAPVNNNEQFCSVLKTRIGEDLVFIGAEVDCAAAPPDHPTSTANYIELKTNRVIANDRQRRTFENKLLKIYLQSYLAGIPKVIVGFRNDDHVVEDLREFATLDIPAMLLGRVDWDANACLSFGASLLGFLKRTVVVDDPDVVYAVRMEEDALQIVVYEGRRDPALRFLPTWYTTGEGRPPDV